MGEALSMGGGQRPAKSQRRENQDLIAMPQEYGASDHMKVRGLPGRFNWNVAPIFSEFVGGGKTPMYAFESDDGNLFYTRLEKQKQGGRWEDAHHAEEDWHWMKKKPQMIEEAWGTHPVSQELQQAALDDVSFEDMKKRIKKYHTWRSISGD